MAIFNLFDEFAKNLRVLTNLLFSYSQVFIVPATLPQMDAMYQYFSFNQIRYFLKYPIHVLIISKFTDCKYMSQFISVIYEVFFLIKSSNLDIPTSNFWA